MVDISKQTLRQSRILLGRCRISKRIPPYALVAVVLQGPSPKERHEVVKWVWTNVPDERNGNGILRNKQFKYVENQSMEPSIQTPPA